VVNLDAPLDTVFINAGAGSTNSFMLNSNTRWTVSDNSSWLIATPINGNADATINLIAIQGNIGPERAANVYINATSGNAADTVVVVQRTSGRFINATPDTVYFDANSTPSQTINLNTNVNWNLSSSASWFNFTPTSGVNNGTATVSAQNNTSNLIRTDFIVVSGNLGASNDTVFIVQDSLVASLSVNPNNITLAQAMGSNSSFIVNSTVSWQTQSGANWLTITNPTSTSDTNTVQISANSINPSVNTRSSFVAVQDVNGILFDTVFVDQIGGLLVLSANPNNVNLNQNAGSNASVNLDANIPWTASPADNWLSINPTSGNDTTTLNVSATTANTSTRARSSFIALEGGSGAIVDTIFVDQQGATPILAVTPKQLNLAQTSGSLDSFQVNSNTKWQVVAGANWLTINTPAILSDSNKVQVVTISANTGIANRSSFVAVQDSAGTLFDTVFVDQMGINAMLSGTPDTLLLGPANGSTVGLNITASHSWTAVEGDTWFSIDQSSGNGNTNLTATSNSSNSSSSQRSSYIVLKDAVNNLTDTVIVLQEGT